jgi:hypothetical protein
MRLVHVIFATLLLYGPDGTPRGAKAAPLNSVGKFAWSGPLYITSGPSFGGPFNHRAVGVDPLSIRCDNGECRELK